MGVWKTGIRWWMAMVWSLLALPASALDLTCGWIRPEPGATHSVYLRHDHRWRSYRLHVPETYRPGAALVLDFHGQTSSARQQEDSSCWKDLAEREGVVVAWPQALGVPATWDAGDYCCHPRGHDDEGFALRIVQCLLDTSRSKLVLDPSRVYAVGLSNGAALAGKLACNRSDQFAGAALASQSFPFHQTDRCRAPDARGWQRPAFPVLEVRGRWDWIVPYGISFGWSATAVTSGLRWAGANQCLGEPVKSDVCDQAGAGADCVPGRGFCLTWHQCEDGVAVTRCSLDDDHFLYENPHGFDQCAAAWQQFQTFPGRR